MKVPFSKSEARAWARENLHGVANIVTPTFTSDLSGLNEQATRHDIRLEVDGGVKVDNIREIKAAGADMFVAGSAIFNKPDYKAVIDEMRAELAKA